jgi:hypothetical protein
MRRDLLRQEYIEERAVLFFLSTVGDRRKYDRRGYPNQKNYTVKSSGAR